MQQLIKQQSAQMNKLESELSEQCAKYNKKCAQNETQISDLLHAKKLLEARNNQLQKGVDQQKLVQKQDEADCCDEYEVEKLLDYKMKKGVRFYLVRWVGYSEEYDTWEKESNLDCQEILDAYHASISNK